VFGKEILNFIEFIPGKFEKKKSLMVIRFFSSEEIYEELDNNNNIWAAYSQNPTAFVSKLFSGKFNFQSSY